LPAAGQDVLFERVVQLSAPGSRIGVEALSPSFFEPGYLERRRQYLHRSQHSGDPDPVDLWFIEERTDLEQWLTERGWQVSVIEALNLMHRYDRSPETWKALSRVSRRAACSSRAGFGISHRPPGSAPGISGQFSTRLSRRFKSCR
jgi:O-methyltransferase involved in polyketide biosynthesis